MLEQMGEAGLAVGLVLRADIVPDRDRDDRRLAVLVDDDPEAVVEGELLVGNVDLADELGDRGRTGGGPRRPACATSDARRLVSRRGEPATAKAESSEKGSNIRRIDILRVFSRAAP